MLAKIKLRDPAGLLCTLSLLIMAAVFYYDTTTMVDSDSYIFPRAIILGILLVGVISICNELINGEVVQRTLIHANYLRSALLIITMAVGISLIPSLGFLAAMLITYICTMYLAMYEKWTPKRRWSYPLLSVVIVAALYFLFERVFIVQFPDGTLFY